MMMSTLSTGKVTSSTLPFISVMTEENEKEREGEKEREKVEEGEGNALAKLKVG